MIEVDGLISAFSGSDLRAAEQRVLEDPSDDILMQRAASGLAAECARVLRECRGGVSGRRVVLLVGSGNNGGDATLAGARLRRRGAWVDAVVVTAGTVYEPGLAALRSAGGNVLDLRVAGSGERARHLIQRADLVVDGLVGLGGTAGLRAPADDLVRVIPAGVPVVAVDLPSGVDPDTGEVGELHVRADVTVTFGAFKPCLLVPPAAYAAGVVVFVDVGVGVLATEPVVQRMTPGGVASRWPRPGPADHKYTRGVLGVVAGSDTYPGAAVLTCAGAVRSGAGVVRFIGPPRVTDHVLAARPEVVPGTGQVQAWLLGSGVEADPGQDAAIEKALTSGLPCVVDAGALDACVHARTTGGAQTAARDVLLTPHAGELARVLSILGRRVTRAEVEAQPMHYAKWVAQAINATVLLKGSTTLVASPSGQVYSQAGGPPWLATAGSGDVLAGIAGTLLAAGLAAPEAGAMAAFIHGQAGAAAAGGGPLAAADIAAALPRVIGHLLSAPGQSGTAPHMPDGT